MTKKLPENQAKIRPSLGDLLVDTLNTIIIIAITLLVIFSTAALVEIHISAIAKGYEFSVSPGSINNYLAFYANYSALFTGTIALTAAYFGLLRLKAANEQNVQKAKQDRFSEWKTIMEIRFAEVDKENPYMRREFIRVRLQLYNWAFDHNFKIEDKRQLTQVFEIFKPLVEFFERMNDRYMEMNCTYPNNLKAYSWDGFQYIFRAGFEFEYAQLNEHLHKMYIQNLPTERIIDETLYKNNLNNILRKSK